MEFKTVSIIIQARSTSKRFPGKIYEKIGNKQILQHVLDACYNTTSYINAYSNKHGMVCGVTLAVPEHDPLITSYSKHRIVEGPENDVLTRYSKAVKELNSDYVVRVTSDCPMIPPFVISKSITLAVNDGLDFLTNADPKFRTSPDGHDVEVMSRRLFDWLDQNAQSERHREHVTALLYESLPTWASKGDIIGFVDLSSVKISVDTEEDLDRLKTMHQKLYQSVKNSPRSYRL